MRVVPDFESYFLPWDPLQLTTETDGGHRAYRNAVNISLFRTFRRKVWWSASLDNGLAVFYDSYDQVVTLMDAVVNQTWKHCRESVGIYYYNFGNKQGERFNDFAKQYYNFMYVPFEKSWEIFLQSLRQHQKYMLQKNEDAGVVEAPNKIIELMFIDLPERYWVEVNNNIQQFLSILPKLADLRIFPCFLTPFAEYVHPDLIAALSQTFFLGVKNQKYVREVLCPNWGMFKNSIGQVVIGFGILSLDAYKLTPIHPLKYTKSGWLKKKQQDLEDEDALYKKFLEQLEG